MAFTRNVVGGAPTHGLARRPFSRIPRPGGENAQEAATVYSGFYGEMPIPATAYDTSAARLTSVDSPPSVRTVASNASIVDRRDRRNGMRSIGGRSSRAAPTPQIPNPVFSSYWQNWLLGPQVNFSQNDDWYIAFPAATISLGTNRNLAWSEKVPQLPTRTSGGPGPAAMQAAPRFKSVQTVPRYSTMPSTYNTTPQNG